MLSEIYHSLLLLQTATAANFPILLRILGILWFFLLFSYLTGGRILLFGIIPRKWYGVLGILFAPLLHAHFNHLFFNSIPLIILADFILIQGVPYFMLVTVLITVISGFLIWCFAKNGLHIGASALVTGYWGFLVTEAYEKPSSLSWILAGICLYYFAGIFLGIFPQKKGVSWEGHLFGLFSGIMVSYFLPTLID